MHEITKDEKLAFLEALQKRMKPVLDDAKAQARQELLESFETTHADRRAILVHGEKVGEVGVSYSSAAPYIHPERYGDAVAFLSEYGLTEATPVKGWEKQFELIGGNVVYKPTGEIVDWAGWSPKAPKTASVRGCKPEDVIKAFGNALPDATALLGAGDE